MAKRKQTPLEREAKRQELAKLATDGGFDAPEKELIGTLAVSSWCVANGIEGAYIVGRWVWAEFADKPSESLRAALKLCGFRWNKKRNAWQHACGHWTRHAVGYDPREKYERQEIGGAT